jgi:dihydropyrimidine dehydrogenase (NAD+) subunit PreT
MRSVSTMEPSFLPTEALNEAWRCLQCFDAPCARACPSGIVIPRFIRMIRSGNLRGAAEVVRSANPMAASCGLACPDEQLCAAACLRARIDAPVAIRRLHRYATEIDDATGPRHRRTPSPAGARVAIVGAGPAGLSCASELRRFGIRAVVFERRDRVGGVLSSAIPLYRFPETAVGCDLAFAAGDAGVCEVRLRVEVGSVAKLAAEFEAVFLSTGLAAHGPTIPGAELKGVAEAEEFLESCRRRRYRVAMGTEVVVIGGGNVAIDAAMAAVRCGAAHVRILYRRTRVEMPAWEREVIEAERAGVVFQYLVVPVELIGARGRLSGVRLQRAALGPPDASGRPTPAPIAGSDFVLPCANGILALGRRVDRASLDDLPLTRGGFLKVNPRTGQVRGNVYAGGDAAGGEQTIVAAVRDGKRAARAIAAALGVPVMRPGGEIARRRAR